MIRLPKKNSYLISLSPHELWHSPTLNELPEFIFTTTSLYLDAELEIVNNIEKTTDSTKKVISSRVLLLQEEVEFLRKALIIAKELKV